MRVTLLMALAAIASFPSLSPAQQGDNMVRNASFEDEKDGLPSGWRVVKNVTVALERGGAPDGDVWLRLKRQEGSSHALAYQRVPVKPSTGYRLRAYIRAPKASYYSLVAYDGVLNTLASKATGWAVMADWLELELDFRTRETDKVVNVGLLGYGPEVHWDAVRMWQDDTVKVGDLSPTVNQPPQLTEAEKERGFLLFTRPREAFTSARYVPKREECQTSITGSSALGETETIMVMLHALRDLKGVSATVPRGSLPEGWEEPELCQIGYSRRAINSQAFIRYPLLLLPPHPVDVPEGDVLQYAVRVRVPNDYSCPPGVKLTLLVSVDGKPGPRVPVALRVLPFRLPPANATFFMYYSDSYLPKDVASAAHQAMYYRDMAEHGMNSVSLYVVPEKKEEDGTFTIDLHHDYRYKPGDPRYALGISERLAQMRAAGLLSAHRPVVLISGGGGLYNWGCFRDVASIRSLLDYQKRMNWPPLLFYVHDEPNNEKRVEYVRSAFENKYAKAPEARTVTAIGDYGIEHVGHLYDVWIASVSSINEAMIERARKSGKELWAYDCRHRGQRPKVDRYLCGLFTWRTGIAGLGQWAYYSRKKLMKNEDGSYAVPQKWDEWYMIASDDGPIGTVGWEARREGVEDYRYLALLERIARAQDGPTARRARALLAEARQLARVDSFAGAPRDWRYIWDFDPAPKLTAAKMNWLREQMGEVLTAAHEDGSLYRPRVVR